MAPSELRLCGTELVLGRSAAATEKPCAGDHQGQGQVCGGDVTERTTEAQARAILRVARRAAVADDDGLSMRRSLEWFLQRRREPRRGNDGAGGAASPSSSSCLTNS